MAYCSILYFCVQIAFFLLGNDCCLVGLKSLLDSQRDISVSCLQMQYDGITGMEKPPVWKQFYWKINYTFHYKAILSPFT